MYISLKKLLFKAEKPLTARYQNVNAWLGVRCPKKRFFRHSNLNPHVHYTIKMILTQQEIIGLCHPCCLILLVISRIIWHQNNQKERAGIFTFSWWWKYPQWGSRLWRWRIKLFCPWMEAPFFFCNDLHTAGVAVIPIKSSSMCALPFFDSSISLSISWL